MDKKFLTPSAQKLIEERERMIKKDVCGLCDGRGTIFNNNPVGNFEQICFSCNGTGKNQILGVSLHKESSL